MANTVMAVITLLSFGVISAGFVWVIIAAASAEAKDHEEFRQEISKYPADVQVQLWRAKAWLDAEQDLH